MIAHGARHLFLCISTCLLGLVQAQATEPSERFLVIGDWGGLPDFPYRTAVEKAVAYQLGQVAKEVDAQYILALGDNFYYNGVKSVDDPRFQETYESTYTAPSLQIPWYFVAGNHDHYGNASAEIAYSSRSKRWNFPNYYYKLSSTITGTSTTIDIIMVDTVLLCGNSGQDRLYTQPEGPADRSVADKQWTWIQQQLQQSKADYLIVAGHYPVLSIAEHGPTKCLVDQLMPMLYKYKVTAFFCGHDHNLQHLQYTQDNHTVDYFVSGAANFIDPSVAHKGDVPPGSLKFHWAEILSLGGLGYVQAQTSRMTFTFIDSKGNLLHQQTMKPRTKM